MWFFPHIPWEFAGCSSSPSLSESIKISWVASWELKMVSFPFFLGIFTMTLSCFMCMIEWKHLEMQLQFHSAGRLCDKCRTTWGLLSILYIKQNIILKYTSRKCCPHLLSEVPQVKGSQRSRKICRKEVAWCCSDMTGYCMSVLHHVTVTL